VHPAGACLHEVPLESIAESWPRLYAGFLPNLDADLGADGRMLGTALKFGRDDLESEELSEIELDIHHDDTPCANGRAGIIARIERFTKSSTSYRCPAPQQRQARDERQRELEPLPTSGTHSA